MTAAATVRCLGAVRTVTGSMHLVEANGDRILLDCGLFQGRRAEARERNRKFAHFDPRSITTLVLSHAHIDHAGNIPNLVKQGFQGEIVCTKATRDLAEIMLEDSATIQEKDAAFLNKKRKPGEALVEPLYTVEDARATTPQLHGIPYHSPYQVGRGMRVTFRDAGHILGSATVELEIDATGGAPPRRVVFTGDVGRAGLPIIRDPEPLPEAPDLVITESTYGDRVHPPVEEQDAKLKEIVRRTADRGGKLIVPAFAVGRTQNLVTLLHRLFLRRELPDLPIYVDSPLSSKATMVYRAHAECYDAETARSFLDDGRDPFGFRRLVYITAVELSKGLNALEKPCIIIASSGMCEAGRILHHLRHNIEDPRATVLIVGFQAEHTLGRRLVEGAPTVKIYGEEKRVRAEVATMNGLSAHADRVGLVSLFRALGKKPATTAVVHGEEKQSLALKARLEEEVGLGGVVVPEVGQPMEVA